SFTKQSPAFIMKLQQLKLKTGSKLGGVLGRMLTHRPHGKKVNTVGSVSVGYGVRCKEGYFTTNFSTYELPVPVIMWMPNINKGSLNKCI
ncbi:MAG: hypothetical protein KBT40_06390, partial [bacterium]|nr:hypothetical protein [Candidatus Minthenecus merdequi]